MNIQSQEEIAILFGAGLAFITMPIVARHVRKEVIIPAALLLGLLVLPLAAKHAGLKLNDTNSVPTGLYRTAFVGNGEYAAVCLPPRAVEIATRARIDLSTGECPDGHKPILKRFYSASAAQPIELSDRGFSVGGRALLNTMPKEKSSKGKPLTHFEFGTYTQGLWVISDYNANSFDSRYFGPIQPGQILYYAAPLWLF